jgi:hypothetical protein
MKTFSILLTLLILCVCGGCNSNWNKWEKVHYDYPDRINLPPDEALKVVISAKDLTVRGSQHLKVDQSGFSYWQTGGGMYRSINFTTGQRSDPHYISSSGWIVFSFSRIDDIRFCRNYWDNLDGFIPKYEGEFVRFRVKNDCGIYVGPFKTKDDRDRFISAMLVLCPNIK